MVDTLGSVIREGRERRGWNQSQLAQSIGVTGSFIGKLEKDEALPSYDRLIALAGTLSLDKSMLLALSERRKEERAQSRIRTRGIAARTAYGLHSTQATEQGTSSRENSDNADFQRALHLLKIVFSDPDLKNVALMTLEAFAAKANDSSRKEVEP